MTFVNCIHFFVRNHKIFLDLQLLFQLAVPLTVKICDKSIVVLYKRNVCNQINKQIVLTITCYF